MTEEDKNWNKKQPVKNTRSNVKREVIKDENAKLDTKHAATSKSKNSAQNKTIKTGQTVHFQRIKSDNAEEIKNKFSSEGTTTLETGVSLNAGQEENLITNENQDNMLVRQMKNTTPNKNKKKIGLIAGICTAVALLGVGGAIAGAVLVKDKPYSISITTEFPDSVSGAGSKYKIGDIVTLNAESVVGYIFKGWQLNGEMKSEQMEYSFKLTKELAGNWEAVYQKVDYTIIANEGIAIVGSLTCANYQDEIKISVAEKTGYILNKVYYTIDEEIQKHILTREENEAWQYKFIMPAGNVKIFAEYSAVDYEIVNLSPDDILDLQLSATYEENVSISVKVKTGYKAKAYLVYDVNGQSEEFEIELDENLSGTFVMPACDVSVEARYTATDYTVTKSASTNGTFKLEKIKDNIASEITASDDNVNVEYKLKISDITPDIGYELDEIFYTLTGSEFRYAITLTNGEYILQGQAQNIEIYVTFKKIEYQLSKVPVTNGSFDFIKNGQNVSVANYGDEITISITPNIGYKIQEVLINGSKLNQINGKYSFVMPSQNVAVEVMFEKTEYSITSGEGIINLSPLSGASYGEKVTFNVENKIGKEVFKVYYVVAGDETQYTPVLEDGTYSFDMPNGNVQIFVLYSTKFYTIVNTNSSFIDDLAESATYGETVGFTVKERQGYTLTNVYYINNDTNEKVNISATESGYEFDMPAANISIYATYTAKSYIITNSNSEFINDLTNAATFGESVSFIVQDREGYTLLEVYYVNSDTSEKVNIEGMEGLYGFDMPACNITIYATYRVNFYSIQTSSIYIDDLVDSASYGENVVFTVQNRVGYTLTKVYYIIDGKADENVLNSVEGKYSFDMPAGNVTIYAVYSINTYGINTSSTYIEELVDSATYGEEVSFTVRQREGYTLRKVYYKVGDNNDEHIISPIDGQYSFNVPAGDVEIFAIYAVNSYSITNNAPEIIADLFDSATYKEVVSFTVEDKVGYNLKVYFKVGGDSKENVIEGVDGTYEFVMPAQDVSVYAEYEVIVYSVSKANTEHGSFEILNGALQVSSATVEDALTIVNINAETGYEVDEAYYLLNGNKTIINLQESSTFNMPAGDIEIFVTFKLVDYTFTISEYGGVVNMSCQKANYKDGVSLTLTAESDSLEKYYNLMVTTASGRNIETTTSDGVVSFEMPAENVKINLEYYKRVYAYGTGAICRDGNNELRPGKNITISYTNQTNYTFIGWAAGSENGSIIAQSTSFASSYDDGLRVNKFYALSCLTASIVAGVEIDGLQYTIYPGTSRAAVTGLATDNADATGVEIPESINYNGETYYVFKVENNAFQGKTSMQNIKFPTGKQFSIIGEYAFSESGVASADLSYGVTAIGKYAFHKCANLISVDLSKIQYKFTINEYLLANSTNLTTIKLPYLISTISSRAFENCTSFKGNVTNENGDVVLDLRGYKSLTTIAGQVFNGCSQITEVYFPLQNCSLGDQVTAACTSLIKIDYGACTANQRGLSSVRDDVSNGKTVNVYIRESSPAINNAAFNGAYITNLYIESTAVYAQITSASSLFSTGWNNTSGRITNIFIRSDIVDADTTDAGATFGNNYLNDSTVFNIERVEVDGVEFVKYTKI